MNILENALEIYISFVDHYSTSRGINVNVTNMSSASLFLSSFYFDIISVRCWPVFAIINFESYSSTRKYYFVKFQTILFAKRTFDTRLVEIKRFKYLK